MAVSRDIEKLKKKAKEAVQKEQKKSSYTFTPKVGSANNSFSDIPNQETSRETPKQTVKVEAPKFTPSTVMNNTFSSLPKQTQKAVFTPSTVMGVTHRTKNNTFHGGKGGEYGVTTATGQELSKFFNTYNAVIRANMGASQKRATIQRMIGNHSDLFRRYENETGKRFDIAEVGSEYGDINRRTDQEKRDKFFNKKLQDERSIIPQVGTFYGDYIRKNGDYEKISQKYAGMSGGKVDDFLKSVKPYSERPQTEYKDRNTQRYTDGLVRYYTEDGQTVDLYIDPKQAKNENLLYMTDEERNIYTALLNTRGEKTADDFLDRLGLELDKRRAARMSKNTADKANRHKVLSGAADILGSFAKGLSLPEVAKQSYKQANSSYDTYRPFDPYNSNFDALTQTRAIKEGITKDMSGAGKTITDFALGLGENAARIPLGPAGLYIMGAGVAAETAVNQGVNGETNASNAFLTGMAYGTVEVLTEKISLDSLMSIMRAPKDEAVTGIRAVLKSIAKNAPKQAGYETSEEALSNIADNIADRIINGDKSEYEEYVRELMRNGASESKARKAAFWDKYVVDTVKDAAAGAASGAIFGTGGSAINGAAQVYDNTTTIGRGLNDLGAGQSVVEEGLARDEQTSANRYAQRLQGRQERGRDLTDWNVGRQLIKNVQSDEGTDSFVNAMANFTPITEHDTLTDTINGEERDINGRLNQDSSIDTSLDSDMSREATIKHEILHWLKRNAPEAYTKLENTVLTAARETNSQAVDNRMNYLMSEYGYDGETAREEIVAELTGGISNRAMQRIAEGNSNLAAKIADGIARVKRDIRREFSNGKFTNTQGVEVAFDEYNKFESELLNMLKDARGKVSENGRQAQTEATVRYSPKGDSTEAKTIKTQIQENLNFLNTLNTVAISTYDLGQSVKQVRQRVGEEFKKIGYKVDRQNFGVIDLREKQINESLNYLNTDAERAALFTVPQVLKRGVEIQTTDNHKSRDYDTVTIAAPVEINGTRGIQAVVVKKVKGNRYKTHRIVMPDGSTFEFSDNKTEATSDKMTSVSESESLSIASDNNIISKNDGNVKNSIKENTGNQTKTDVRYSIAGRGARTANIARLGTAQELQAQGISNEEIWQRTGWAKGLEGEWKFEFDDSKSRYIGGDITGSHKLSDIFEHDALYEAYPDLRDMEVYVTDNTDKKGTYSPEFDNILLNENLSEAEKRKTLLHEVQHAIQVREGFAVGANSDSENYRNTAGEIEARDVSARADMTAAERQANFPESMKPRDGVVFADRGVMYSVTENADKIKADFGITNINDYIHVQKSVNQTLLNEGFFDDKGGRSKTVTNDESGMSVEITPKGIKETLGDKNFTHLGKKLKLAKIATIRDLPRLIKNGHLISDNVQNEHNQNSNLQYAYIETEAELYGEPITVSIAIRKSPQKNKFWVHKIDFKQKNNGVPSQTKSGMGYNSSAINNNVPQNSPTVKRFSAKEGNEYTPTSERKTLGQALNDNREDIINSEPLANYNRIDTSLSAKQIKSNILESYKQRYRYDGQYFHIPTDDGEVLLHGGLIENAADKYLYSDGEISDYEAQLIAGIYAIPDVIQSGKEIGKFVSDKGHTSKYIGGLITIDGAKGDIGIAIRNTAENKSEVRTVRLLDGQGANISDIAKSNKFTPNADINKIVNSDMPADEKRKALEDKVHFVPRGGRDLYAEAQQKGKEHFDVTREDIEQYVDNAYTKQNNQDYKKYAKPSERLINDLSEDMPDIEEYSHALRDNDIRHIHNSHGEGNTNEKYPVTKADIKQIPDIVENYDKAIYYPKGNKRGVMYVKVAPNGLVYYLEQATQKYGNEKLLVNKQMIKTGIEDIPSLPGLENAITKKQSLTEFLNDLKQAQQVYVQDEYQSNSVSDNSIPQTDGDVKKKVSKLYENTMHKDAYTSEFISEADRRKPEFMYDGITNKETYEAAQAFISSAGQSETLAELSMKKGGWTAYDTARCLALMSQYQTEGNHVKAVDVASMLRERMTEAGQAIQALKIVNKLSPEGQLIDFERSADRMVQKQINRRSKDEQNQIRTELKEAREKDKERRKQRAAKDNSDKWYHESRYGEGTNPQDVIDQLPDLPEKEIRKPQQPEVEEKNFVDQVLDAYGIEHFNSEELDYAASALETIDSLDTKQDLIDLIIQQSKKRKTASHRLVRAALKGESIEFLKDTAVQQVFGFIADKTPSSVASKISTYQAMSHLLNARTMNRNITSNAVFDRVDRWANNTAVVADAIMGIFSGKRTVGYDRGWVEGLIKDKGGRFKAGYKRAKQTYIDTALAVNHNVDSTKYGTQPVRRTFKSRIGGGLERALSYGLTVTDEFQKGAISYSEGKALERLKKRGFNDAEVVLVLEETEKYRTFQDNSLPAQILNGLKGVLNVIGTGDKTTLLTIGNKEINTHEFGLGDIVCKYTTVPGNLVSRSIEYSPLGYVKFMWNVGEAIKNKAKGVQFSPQTQRKIALSLARPTTGTGIIAMAVMLASAGILVGEREDESKEQKNFENAEGIGNLQINWSALDRWMKSGFREKQSRQEGDALMSIGYLEPMNSQLAIGASIANMDGGMAKPENWSKAISAKTFDQVLDMPTMSTIKDTFNTLQYNDNAGLPEVLFAVGTSGATGFVPSVVRQTASFMDKSARNPYNEENEFEKAKQRFKAVLPGARETVPEKITPFGETKKNTTGNRVLDFFNNFVNPGDINTYHTTEISKEVNRLGAMDTDAFPHTPKKSFKYDNQQYKLYNNDYAEYSRLVGQNTYNNYNDLINSEDYKNMSDEDKIAALKKAADKAEKDAQKAFAGQEVEDEITSSMTPTEATKYNQKKDRKADITSNYVQKLSDDFQTAYTGKDGYDVDTMMKIEPKKVKVGGKEYEVSGETANKIAAAAEDKFYDNIESFYSGDTDIDYLIGRNAKTAKYAEDANGKRVYMTGSRYNADGSKRFDETVEGKIIFKLKEAAINAAAEEYADEITGSTSSSEPKQISFAPQTNGSSSKRSGGGRKPSGSSRSSDSRSSGTRSGGSKAVSLSDFQTAFRASDSLYGSLGRSNSGISNSSMQIASNRLMRVAKPKKIKAIQPMRMI